MDGRRTIHFPFTKGTTVEEEDEDMELEQRYLEEEYISAGYEAKESAEAQHNPPADYKCDYCNITFAEKSLFGFHIRNNYPEEMDVFLSCDMLPEEVGPYNTLEEEENNVGKERNTVEEENDMEKEKNRIGEDNSVEEVDNSIEEDDNSVEDEDDSVEDEDNNLEEDNNNVEEEDDIRVVEEDDIRVVEEDDIRVVEEDDIRVVEEDDIRVVEEDDIRVVEEDDIRVVEEDYIIVKDEVINLESEEKTVEEEEEKGIISLLSSTHNLKLYGCNICTKSFEDSNTLIAHTDTHGTFALYCCPNCHKYYLHIKNIYRSHHDLKCKCCEQNPVRKRKAGRSGDRSICGECGKMFHKRHIAEHLWTHEDGKHPYYCTVCDFSFVKIENLRDHIVKGCKRTGKNFSKISDMYFK